MLTTRSSSWKETDDHLIFANSCFSPLAAQERAGSSPPLYFVRCAPISVKVLRAILPPKQMG